VTTCVTRSIGDWDASRALIPHPDVTRFVVNPGEHVRVIMASDGMWDMVTTAEALRTARRAATAQQAADRLVALAYRRSASRFNELRDDTTCVVVDVNPDEMSFQPPDGEKMGTHADSCCLLA